MGQASWIVVVIFVALAVAAGVWWLRKRPSTGDRPAGALAFQSVGFVSAVESRRYRPENVGNDASARPWEQQVAVDVQSANDDVVEEVADGSQPVASGPVGFEKNAFLKAAKANFVTLQAAWDAADIATLRSMMTDDMAQAIHAQLAQREAQPHAASQATEVVMIEAQLLDVRQLADQYLASVEFSGLLREDASAGPSPFRELWNLSKPLTGAGPWRVAGVQALQ